MLLLLDAASGAPLEQYVFRTSLDGAALASSAAVGVVVPDVPATYADLETMLSAALLRFGLLPSQLPPLPPRGGVTFTILLRTHEVLGGPNDRADCAAASCATASGFGAEATTSGSAQSLGGGSGEPWAPGVLGAVSGRAAAAESRPPPAAAQSTSGAPLGASGGQSYWLRVDAGDTEAALSDAAAAAAHRGALARRERTAPIVAKWVKCVRAGKLALDVSVEYPPPVLCTD